MLKTTKAGNTVTTAKILKYAHNMEIPLLSYNHEVELAAITNLVYLAARDSYRVIREDMGGIRYMDFIFYPMVNMNDDCIILELKSDSTAEQAIRQIKYRKYALAFAPKVEDSLAYTEKKLTVGIGYDRRRKKHECRVKILEELL
ncbi:hypothetical protein AALD74_18080 [Lachnospiraceae bacterium 48-21]